MSITKLVSWNVNGLRSCLQKGFTEQFQRWNADIVCVQETKMQEGQAEILTADYHQFWNSAEKKGYSGTAVFSKEQPLEWTRGIGIEEHGKEGRVLTLHFKRFTLVNVYTPNAQAELTRLDYRMKWEDAFRNYLVQLDKKNPVIICGDMNVAHKEIDLKNPKTNHHNAGFTDEERGKMSELLAAGFADTFRTFYPDRKDAYTWWSYRSNARAKNTGWRIDYFLVSRRLMPEVKNVIIEPEVLGSDHCPVVMVMK